VDCAKEALIKIGTEEVIDRLISALKDPKETSKVKKMVVSVLGNMRVNTSDVSKHLLRMVKSDNVEDRKVSLETLGEIGAITPDVVNDLIIDLRNGGESDEVKKLIGDVFRKIKVNTIPVVEALLYVLKESEKGKESEKRAESTIFLRRSAIDALGEIRATGTNVTDVLVVALEDEDLATRNSAAKALGKIRENNKKIRNQLLISLKDDNMKENVVEALGKIKASSPAAIQGLLSSLKDPEIEVRKRGATAMGRIKDRLLFVLKDKSHKHNLSKYLSPNKAKAAKIHDIPRVISGLLDLLYDKDEEVQIFTIFSLKKIEAGISNPVVRGIISALRDLRTFHKEKKKEIRSKSVQYMGSN